MGLLILGALLGGAPEVGIRGRRYRLSVEQVFRLEEIDGAFVFFIRNAGALERRLTRLAGGRLAGGSRVRGRERHRMPTN